MAKKMKSKWHGWQVSSQVIEPPPEVAESMRRITNEDRGWFEAHPNAKSYTRPAAVGEFWPLFDSDCVVYVIVTQVRPGWRLRAPVLRMNFQDGGRVQ
jgi:hypothetical protein